MNDSFINYVKSLSEEQFISLYAACKIRLANNIKKIVVYDQIINLWKKDKLIALLTMRELYPEYGLNELKNSINNRVEELGLTRFKK